MARQRTLATIQPQVGLARMLIEAVARKAVFGQDRADVAVVEHLRGHRLLRPGFGKGGAQPQNQRSRTPHGKTGK
jgi:hypothetical protein